MTKWDSILFDLDGTLWDAVKNITSIWNEGIKGHPAAGRALTEKDVRSIMGLTTKEIGQTLFPSASEKEQEELMICCGEAEQRLLPHTGGILYPHLEETLAELKRSLPLFIVSNCDQGYIEAFLSYHQLTDYFTDFLCYGDTGLDKPDNIRRIVSAVAERKDEQHFARLVSNDEVGSKQNNYNLSVSTYVEAEDTREKIDIVKLNAEIEEIVAREQILRDEIDKIIAELEGN